jgi:CIC family chloride channel protein
MNPSGSPSRKCPPGTWQGCRSFPETAPTDAWSASISRSDILRAYDVGIVRKQRGQMEEKEFTLRPATETGFVEMAINEDNSCCNVPVKDLPLPENVTLVSIKRGSKMIIPRGRHQIKVGDVLTLFGQLDEIEQFKTMLN